MAFRPVLFGATLACLTLSAGLARADIIVNISGTANGEQVGNQSCSITCNGALIDPVQVTLGPGTYLITDAWSPTNSTALYGSWNFEAGNPTAWSWHWKVLYDDGDDGATIDPSNYASHLIADVDPTEAFSTAAAAALFGYNTAPLQIALSSTTTLDFIVNDYYLPDNAGGVSLDVHDEFSSVPEAPTWTMMIAGLAGLGFMRHWRIKARRTEEESSLKQTATRAGPRWLRRLAI